MFKSLLYITIALQILAIPDAFASTVKCDSLVGIKKDKCLLSNIRQQIGKPEVTAKSCDTLTDKTIKTICLADVTSRLGDATYCYQLTHEYSLLIRSDGSRVTSLTDAEIAMTEREGCYNRVVFAQKNKAVNQNWGNYRYAYNEATCAAEPREIVKNYCYFRLSRCDLIKEATIAKDCITNQKLYGKPAEVKPAVNLPPPVAAVKIQEAKPTVAVNAPPKSMEEQYEAVKDACLREKLDRACYQVSDNFPKEFASDQEVAKAKSVLCEAGAAKKFDDEMFAGCPGVLDKWEKDCDINNYVITRESICARYFRQAVYKKRITYQEGVKKNAVMRLAALKEDEKACLGGAYYKCKSGLQQARVIVLLDPSDQSVKAINEAMQKKLDGCSAEFEGYVQADQLPKAFNILVGCEVIWPKYLKMCGDSGLPASKLKTQACEISREIDRVAPGWRIDHGYRY